MVNRTNKKVMLKFIKVILYFVFIYYIFILFTGKLQKKTSDELSEKSSSLETVSKLSDEVFKTSSVGKVTPPSKDLNQVSSKDMCPELSFPWKLTTEGAWLPVDKSRSMYVVSAYNVKDTYRNSVFVVGIRPDNNNSVVCQLWGGNKEIIKTVAAKEPSFLDYHGYEHTTTVFECPTPKYTKQPVYVSIAPMKCDPPSNVLKIQDATKEFTFERDVTVCLTPKTLISDQTLNFINWVEINKLLGVDKFVVYNYTCGPNIDRLLEYYAKNGLIEVVQWKPAVVLNGIRAEPRTVQLEQFGETTALNDCLFRNKKYSKFIANIGINEFIIPRLNESLAKMISNLKIDVAAYHIDMAFVDTVGKDKETKTTVHTGLNGNHINKMIIRTSRVYFTLTRQVPGEESVRISIASSVLHKHSQKDVGQFLGTVVEKVVPTTLMEKVNRKVQNIQTNLRNVTIL